MKNRLNLLIAIGWLFTICFFASPYTLLASPIDSLLQVVDKSEESDKFNLWLQIGLHYRDGGSFDSALLSFNQSEKYVKTQSQQGDLLHNKGSLAWRMGSYESAKKYYDSAIFVRRKIGDSVALYKSMYYQSLVFRDQSEYVSAISLSKQIIKAYQNLNDSAALADIYNQLGGIFIRLNQFDSAQIWYKKSIDIRFAMNDSLKMADSYSNMGKMSREQGLYADAINHYKNSLGIFKQLKDREKESYTRLLLGGTYWEAKKYQEALKEYLYSLRLYTLSGNQQQIASIQKNIGLIYRDIGNIEKAVEYHLKSLELYQSIGNTSLVGVGVSILAGDYWSAGNYRQALKTYKRALSIREKIGNKTHIAGSYNNVALAYKSLNQADSALLNYRKALLLYRQLQDKRNQAAILNNIGSLQEKNNVFDSAAFYFSEALELRQAANHKQGIGYSSLSLGQLYINMKKYEKSIDLLMKAHSVAQELTDYYLLKESCFKLSEVYQKQGKYDLALRFYMEFFQADKHLQVDESIRRVADMQIRFESEKRMRIVEKKDAELKQQKQRIYYLIVGILLLFILIVAVVLAFIQKKKSNKLLASRNLEIQEQKVEIEKQRDLAEAQRDTIAAQNEKIKNSILYASRIQNAVLPPDNLMSSLLKQHFILFKPRDVVSGDFYYFQTYQQFTVIAAADCTGHGVPGAFMSMLGISVLNEIIAMRQADNAGSILNILREKIKQNLHQTSLKEGNRDGMDISLIMLNRENNYLHFAGANNPLVIIRNEVVLTYQGDKMPIGVHVHDKFDFTNHKVKIEKEDKLYMYSDGFIDQFGGSSGRKLMSRNFRNLLFETSNLDMENQKKKMETFFESWIGSYRQIDDVLVIGLEI